MSEKMLRLLGWRALLIHGDPCVLDRFLWLRGQLRGGRERTFDAGCGNGAFSIYAARLGNEVVAASFSSDEQRKVSERAAALGVTGVEVRTLDLRELDRHRDSLGTFDQVICLETIEHIDDDEGLLASLAAMLNPGGRILVSTPFEGHRPLYSEERDPTPLEDGSHVRYGYSQERLRRIVEGAGLEVSSEGFISGVASQSVTNLMRRLKGRFGPIVAWLAVLPLRTLVIADRPLTRIGRYPYLSVALTAVKPPR